jgi:hypothetical protein
VLVRFKRGLAASFALVAGLSPAWERPGLAQNPPADPESAPAEPESTPAEPPGNAGASFGLPAIAIHGFISQGAFWSTDNDYLGHSERGSVEFLEAAVNVSTEVADRLRVGAQLFTRDVGPIGNYQMALDWAYLDYRWRDWLGLRAGRIKMPFGLHNEFSDVDAARLPVLLPQSVYPMANRDFLLAQTGFALHGDLRLGASGGLDYQLFGGTTFGQGGLLDLGSQLTLRESDTEYVAGGQLFWRTPLPGLRLGASYLHTNFTFHLLLDAYTTDQWRMDGIVPPEFDGAIEVGLRDIDLAIGSLEYAWRDWIFSAEYSRWRYHTYSSLAVLDLDADEDNERLYGMAAYRVTSWLEAGAYYSLYFVDAGDRGGHDETRFAEAFRAQHPVRHQRLLAVEAGGSLHRRRCRPAHAHEPGPRAPLGLLPHQDDRVVLGGWTRE